MRIMACLVCVPGYVLVLDFRLSRLHIIRLYGKG